MRNGWEQDIVLVKTTSQVDSLPFYVLKLLKGFCNIVVSIFSYIALWTDTKCNCLSSLQYIDDVNEKRPPTKVVVHDYVVL